MYTYNHTKVLYSHRYFLFRWAILSSLPPAVYLYHILFRIFTKMSLLTKSTLLSFLLPLVSAGPSGFGHAFSSGPTADGNWIRTANSTLVVPSPPLPQKGLLSLWVGMGTSNGDLIQALVESYNDAIDAGCGVLDGDWCAWTSTLVSTGQQGGKEVLANVGDEVKMSCKCQPFSRLKKTSRVQY